LPQSSYRLPTGHALTIDHGWREVADTALDFIRRHLSLGDAAQKAKA